MYIHVDVSSKTTYTYNSGLVDFIMYMCYSLVPMGIFTDSALWNVNKITVDYGVIRIRLEMQLFGGQKLLCWLAKCMAFPLPLTNSQPAHLPVDSYRLFRTVACISRSDCTRCVVFASRASLSEYLGGWLCTGGIVCVCSA